MIFLIAADKLLLRRAAMLSWIEKIRHWATTFAKNALAMAIPVERQWRGGKAR
jgi:hypothetical protein